MDCEGTTRVIPRYHPKKHRRRLQDDAPRDSVAPRDGDVLPDDAQCPEFQKEGSLALASPLDLDFSLQGAIAVGV